MSEVQYASAEQALAWKSPEPLTEDYTHSEAGLLLHIEGLSRAKDRKAIYSEISRLGGVGKAALKTVGYEPEDADIVAACWAESCVKAPKMTAFQWLQFGAEASLQEVYVRCLVASRVIEDKAHEDAPVVTPDGETAAEAELEADPT